MNAGEYIESGHAVLGIELGSTRIKAVLIDSDHSPLASGSHEWENRYENGIWTYSEEDVWEGIRDCYEDLCRDVQEKYGVTLTKLSALGVSAMMHGYMPFNAEGERMVPYRTWRNTVTAPAAEELTKLFAYPIPQRWSIAHLYQAILNGEEHVKDINFIMTLEGYVHWKLTGRKVIGIGEASGMFPIDPQTKNYNAGMIKKFNDRISSYEFPWRLEDILPEVLCAGEEAGSLTEEGAEMLDSSGNLRPGIPLCPPEGDAGTGMTATNAVKPRRGNVSAGTSVFSMVVLEKELSWVYPQIDLVSTPSGSPVAMVHCNNCTSDINAWVDLFGEMLETAGVKVEKGELFGILFQKALEGEPDCGGLLSYNFLSGEHVMNIMGEGRPLFLRRPDSHMNLANFMRTHLYSALAALKAGNASLAEEGVAMDCLVGHGGFFKTPLVGQKILAAALNVPVSVMETAGEGGPWGMAILAAYSIWKTEGQSLEDYLDEAVFRDQHVSTVQPDPVDVKGFDAFLERFLDGIPVEQAAVSFLK